MDIKKCNVCGKEITGKGSSDPRRKYCSHLCGIKHQNEQHRKLNPFANKNLSTGTVGAISELKTAKDLLIKGYEVFRAISPSCSCDLAILKKGKLLRVEVRTAYKYPSGKIITPNVGNIRSDILAKVIGEEIIYEPSLD